MSRPFVMDEPIELPDGTLRCKLHHLEVCGICCVDYTFMRDIIDEAKGDLEDAESSDGVIEADEESKMQTSKRTRCAVCRQPASKQCSRCKQVYYCDAAHQQEDWGAHKKQCMKPKSAETPKPRILVLAVGGSHKMVDEHFDTFFRMIDDKAAVSRAVDVEKATRLLKKRPSAVIVGDLLHPRQQSALLDSLVEYAKKGGTIVFGLLFSSFARPPDIDVIFARFGLSWKSGPYHRADFILNRDGPATKKPNKSKKKKIQDKRPKEELSDRSDDPLPATFQAKALQLKNVPAEQCIYLEAQFEGKLPVDKSQSLDTPIAFGSVGKGWVGYIGDVNAPNDDMAPNTLMHLMISPRSPVVSAEDASIDASAAWEGEID